MENAQIADIFAEIADLLELQGGNEFRVRSYRNAARTIQGLSQRVEDMAAEGRELSDLPNIGKSTAEKIKEIIETGTCQRLEDLRREMPEGLTQLTRIPQLGPRKATMLYKELGVQSPEELRQACEQHKVRELKGMGAKSEQNILEGLGFVQAAAGRVLRSKAAEYVDALGRYLDGLKTVRQWAVAGSFRRCKETVGDLDILVQSDHREKTTEQILKHKTIDEVLSRGKERLSVRLRGHLQVDFRYFEPSNFGAALMYFTGSKAHNIALRKRAQQHDWKLNEYGLFKGDNLLSGKDEPAVYRRLGLPWIPPELREDRGEVEAAEKDKLPVLVELKDMRGDLHAHTNESDGADTLEAMAQAAIDRGRQFLAITEHSKRVSVANGLDDDRCRRHADRIRELDESLDDLWLMAGIEVDVLKSGKLDLDEKLLADLDWVVASIHYDRNMDRKKMTERILAAVNSGVVHCLGHLLGRMIGQRDAIQLDFDKIVQACAENNVYLEINAQPDRLDLPDTYCKEAMSGGVKFAIGTDAHRTDDLDLLGLGVNVARRGWLGKSDVLNTLTAKQLRKRLKKT